MKAYAKTDPECPDQEERSFHTSLTVALVRLRGAFWRVTLAAVAMGQASSAFAVRRWRSIGAPGRASTVAKKARIQRAAAQPGAVGDAPPRRLAHARRLAAHPA